MLGTYVLSHGYYDAYYLKAQKVRALIADDFRKAFDEVDAIVAPVSPFPAFKLGEKIDDPMEMYLSDIYTITGDLAGIPCMSVPCGNTTEGLPVGLQILASISTKQACSGSRMLLKRPAASMAQIKTSRGEIMAFTLPPLPYAFDALEPYIDKMTMEIHHGKHHGAYVTNLNKALESAPDLQSKTVEELLANNCAIVPENIRTAVRNNGGGHINHSMFWTIMAPSAGGQPLGQCRAGHQFRLRQFRCVQGKIQRRGHRRFGSGWAWLVKSRQGSRLFPRRIRTVR